MEGHLDHSLSEIYPQLSNSTFTGSWMYLHWSLYGDKCKYVDVRNVINLQVHLLFFAAEVLEDKAREKDSVNVHIFQQLIALSKTERFQHNSER